MKNWPEYWPDFIRIESPPAGGWSRPGDKVTVEIRLLHRARALNMELEEFQKDARVRYVSRQRGLPDVRHERHFDAASRAAHTAWSSNTSPTGADRALRQAVRQTIHRTGDAQGHAESRENLSEAEGKSLKPAARRSGEMKPYQSRNGGFAPSRQDSLPMASEDVTTQRSPAFFQLSRVIQ